MIYPIWTFRKCDIPNVNKGKTVLKCAVYQYANEKAVVHSKYPLLFSNHKSQVQLQAVNWKGKRHHLLNCYWKEAKIDWMFYYLCSSSSCRVCILQTQTTVTFSNVWSSISFSFLLSFLLLVLWKPAGRWPSVNPSSPNSCETTKCKSKYNKFKHSEIIKHCFCLRACGMIYHVAISLFCST